MSLKITVAAVDALLPQTQCGLCGYGGCMPYAKALVEDNAPINLCPPGGLTILHKLADLLNQDAKPHIVEMQQKQKPVMTAVIREAECIGCTRCIQACPVDAILGSGKLMHSVIASECTGCELCVAPCPVDCIDMVTLNPEPQIVNPLEKNYRRSRFHARETRLSQLQNKSKQKPANPLSAKQDYLQAALMRARKKS